VELKIEEDSKLCHVSLLDMYKIVKCKVLVCAVLRNGVCITPDGSFTLEEGDRIFVTAPTDNLTALLKNLGVVTHRAKRVLLAGGGTLAYYLAGRLLKNRISVQILEKDEKRCRHLAELLPEAEVIQGDASDRQALDSERFSTCDALVALTGLDEMNIILSLWGSAQGIPAVITKLGRMENTSLIDSLPVGSVVSPRKLCCGTIVRYVRAMQDQTAAALTIHTIADGQAEAIEFPIDKTTLHCGEPLKNLKTKKNVLVACITRGKDVEIPNGDSSFHVGDRVVVVVSGDEVLLHFNDIFEA
jgi:trk system potassium uptake protein TrkA